MDEEFLYLVALSTTDVIGSARYQKIVTSPAGLSGFMSMTPEDQAVFLGLRDSKVLPPLKNMLRKGEKALETCAKKGIRLLRREDPDFPSALRDIPQAPYLLYAWGHLNHTLPRVAVVGTRSVTPEAEAVNRYFCRELAEYHIAVVSGLAKGHDAIAAHAVLDSDGYTIAVLGTGIDVPFPASNSRLYDRIRDTGLLLSEYPPGAPGLTFHFPLRNRIISGLSRAVLVIQAPRRSGALITARYAEEQGRELFVIPGNPLDEKCAGTNELLQKGAKLALKPEDIIQDILERVPRKTIVREEAVIQDVSPEEKAVLSCLERETYIEDIQADSGLDTARINALLTGLELKGLVRQYPGRFYSRNYQ